MNKWFDKYQRNFGSLPTTLVDVAIGLGIIAVAVWLTQWLN